MSIEKWLWDLGIGRLLVILIEELGWNGGCESLIGDSVRGEKREIGKSIDNIFGEFGCKGE